MTNALQFLVLTTAAWLNRQQEDVIDYLWEGNRILREKNRQTNLLLKEEYGEAAARLIRKRECRFGLAVISSFVLMMMLRHCF